MDTGKVEIDPQLEKKLDKFLVEIKIVTEYLMGYVYGRRNLREGHLLFEELITKPVEFKDVNCCHFLLKKIVSVFRKNVSGSKDLKSMRDMIFLNSKNIMRDIYGVTTTEERDRMSFEIQDHAKGLVIEYCNRFVKVSS